MQFPHCIPTNVNGVVMPACLVMRFIAFMTFGLCQIRRGLSIGFVIYSIIHTPSISSLAPRHGQPTVRVKVSVKPVGPFLLENPTASVRVPGQASVGGGRFSCHGGCSSRSSLGSSLLGSSGRSLFQNEACLLFFRLFRKTCGLCTFFFD